MTTPINNEELRKAIESCPFCGSANIIVAWEPCPPLDEGDTNRRWFAECTQCSCQGPFCQKEPQVIPAWNIRVAAKRLLDEGEKCAVLQSQVDNADVTLRQQKLCTEAERSKREELERKLGDAEHTVDAQANMCANIADTCRARGVDGHKTLDERVIELAQRADQCDSLRQQLDAEKAKVADREELLNVEATWHSVYKQRANEHFAKIQSLTTANQRLREALEQWKVKVDDGYGGITLELCAIAKDALSQTPEATDEGKDTARLDWLEKRKRVVPGGWYGRKGDAAEWENPSASWGLTHSVNEGTYTIPDELKQLTLRQAIDQAIAAMASKTEGLDV